MFLYSKFSDEFFSKNDRHIGMIATKHIATAGQLIPFCTTSAHAVVAITPPMVRLALHRFKSPFVLNASVTSKFSRIGITLMPPNLLLNLPKYDGGNDPLEDVHELVVHG